MEKDQTFQGVIKHIEQRDVAKHSPATSEAVGASSLWQPGEPCAPVACGMRRAAGGPRAPAEAS